MRTIIRDNYAPENGDYHDRLVIDTILHRKWLFDCDGVFTPFGDVEVVNEEGLSSTKAAAQALVTNIANELREKDSGLTSALEDEVSARESGDISTLTEAENYIDEHIDETVITSVEAISSPSTVEISTDNINLLTKETHTTTSAIPVASASQSGIMNSATFKAVQDNAALLEALSNGAVAIAGLPASPSQAQLSEAWETETGIDEPINRAMIFDSTNDKVWTYYTNDSTWHASNNTAQVTINKFTNTSEGVIKGSLDEGQVYAENDGTGSVNGWDALKAQADNATAKLATVEEGAQANVQANWAETDVDADDFIKNKPNFAAVATSGSYTDLTNKPNLSPVATSGSYTDLTDKPTIINLTLSTTDIGEGVALAANTLYGVYR